jgi:molybdopterin synthase catalytic subunit
MEELGWILRFAQDDICEMVCKPKTSQCGEHFRRMTNLVCKILVTEAPPEAPRIEVEPAAGAVVDFFGIVRGSEDGHAIEGIDYEAHREMAEHQLRKIAEQAAEDFGLKQVLIHHRIGFIAVGEPSLFMRVCSPHRNEAFRAGQWIVDELKKKVPIWKRPRFKAGKRPDAAHRVAGTV